MLTKESIKSKLLLCAAALSLGAMGCATDDMDAETEGFEDADELALQAPASAEKPAADGAYFVSVKPNGTGCPAGTADVSISPDGKTFTVSFSAYEAIVDENKSVDVKNCQLGIKLRSPNGLSYSVYDFFYQGYAYLARGQSAKQIAKYYFQGEPVKNQRQVTTDLVGPFDDTYTFQDTIGIVDAVWSPCGATRDLQVNTTLRLDGKNGRKDGYINVSAADGSTETKARVPFAYKFKLGWKKCN